MKTILYIGNILKDSQKTLATIDTLSENLRQDGYKVITTSSKNNKLFRLFDMLWHIIKHRTKVDYVLIDTYSTLNFYYAYLCSQLCRLFKLKYVPILHGGNLPDRLNNSPIKSRQIFKNAFLNIAPSNYIKSSFESFGFSNIKCIANTIEVQKYSFMQRNFDKPKLLWVRAFSKIYNPQLALELLKDLCENNIEAELCMVGPDKDGSLLEVQKLANNLGLDVKFTGKLSKDEWINLSKEYNIFINTTNVDNTPVSVIEAMALGLPVISTNVGGLPFLIDNLNTGILVQPNDVKGFENAILRLINNDELVKKVSYNARQKVEQFDWNVVKHDWFSVLS
ncbi:MAG: glycosyltransferase family 4 protein [Jejuia sp.]